MPAGCVIGVDLGGTKLLAGAVDGSLAVHHRASRRAAGAAGDELVALAVSAVAEVRDASESEVGAVGVALPAGSSASDVLAERVGVPVFAGPRGALATLAEHRAGAARGYSEALVLTIGTSIGGGVVADGRVVEDAVLALDEHVSAGALAREGLRVARATPESSLARALAAGREISGAVVIEHAYDGDRAARDILALLGVRLGAGIEDLVERLRPAVVVVGGSMVAAGDMLLEPARAVGTAHGVPVVPARFGAESAMLGAAVLAFDGLGAAAAAA
ncbi:MAG TPA: ROK family protein [Solirubrobacteraceae bacterium]|nr:ROK family protein [Solirubrobacteraceae bacterium]